MKVDLAAVVGRFGNVLGTLDHLLTKGAEHCAAQGILEADMLEWRMAPDMFPLRSQLQFVVNLTRQWASRAAGVEPPPAIEGETGVADLHAAITEARAFVAAFDAEQFAGRDDEPLTVDLRQMAPTLPIGQWVVGFATTNIHFHLSIAYAILRARGVEIGKRDLFAGGL
jgi:hypothetical protein